MPDSRLRRSGWVFLLLRPVWKIAPKFVLAERCHLVRQLSLLPFLRDSLGVERVPFPLVLDPEEGEQCYPPQLPLRSSGPVSPSVGHANAFLRPGAPRIFRSPARRPGPLSCPFLRSIGRGLRCCFPSFGSPFLGDAGLRRSAFSRTSPVDF